ncbi:DUF2071 domain-containing protein [Kitasatospora sp. NBC_01539]|uniref:DUF2071 domain-containing protein n=1 Tax=Kitasatospora sp. NBC_01539 TaxID=2903577 RepID=UPI0038601808
MRTPHLASTVERRLLVNYRTDPDTTARLLPPRLRPQLVRGHAVAGLCLLRLGDVRPARAPGWTGLRSENAAHRIAVEWDGPDGVEAGVYITRRDTASRINAWAGGRIFPGAHGLADFRVDESAGKLSVAFTTHDGAVHAEVTAAPADRLDGSVLFDGLAAASAFFRTGSRGWSPAREPGRLDGMQLRTDAWHVEAAVAHSAASSFFDDPERFPPGSAELDCTLLMRGVPARWQALPPLQAA